MKKNTIAMVSPEQWGDCDPMSRTMLEEAGIKLIRNEKKRLLIEPEMKELIKGCNVAICGAEPMSANVMDQAPDLRFIARCAVGLDSIDLMAARERNIGVSYVPGANAEAVAELTVSHILTLIRGVQQGDRLMREGKWLRVLGRSLEELTIGIIGVGRIGRRVAKYLSMFGARIIANDINPDESLHDHIKIEWVSKDRLLKESDIVSIHVPKTPDTLDLISYEELKIMKNDAFLINCARGGLVNEDALLQALKNNKIAGAGLDVYGVEPYEGGPLSKLPNVIMTCHMGANTKISRARMEIQAAECLLAYLQGDHIPRIVPDSEYDLQVAMKNIGK
jgi:D-3-phosphoglycerate dehydrogenase